MKKELSIAELEAQSAFQLPAREMLALITVVITNVLNGNHVNVNVSNNKVAVQVCAAVNAINSIIAPTTLTCVVGQ